MANKRSNLLFILALVDIGLGIIAAYAFDNPTLNAVGKIMMGLGGFMFLFANWQRNKQAKD